MNAAGMSANLEDTEVPKDTITSASNSAGFTAAYGAAGYSTPLPGLSSGATASLNIASSLFAPVADTARTSFFAWAPHPELTAEQVKQKLGSMLISATQKAAEERGYKVHVNIAENGKDQARFSMAFDKTGTPCNNKTWKCTILVAARPPIKETRALSNVNAKPGDWFFNPAANLYSDYSFVETKIDFNQIDLLLGISKNMPNWFYIYVPPGKLYMDAKTRVEIPMLITAGQVKYFMKEKQ